MNRIRSKYAMTAVYSVSHFFVDLACAYYIFGICAYKESSELMLIYNFCAFALQMPMGIILDRLSGRRSADSSFAAAGCMIIAAVLFFGRISGGGALSAAAVGIGNAAFHIGGGTHVLYESKGASALGIFVSPGAIGLYLGTVMGKGMPYFLYIIGAVMVINGLMILLADRRFGYTPDSKEDISSPVSAGLRAAAVLLFTVVCIRSIVGFGISFEWKSGVGAALAVTAAALGKAFGGILSDRTSPSKASAISAFSAAVLFIFGENIICGALGILLFNMSMPLTLKGAADIFTDKKGFSFGLLTFGLFIGFIPVYAERTAVVFSPCILSAASVISGILLLTALYIIKRNVSDDNSTDADITVGNTYP